MREEEVHGFLDEIRGQDSKVRLQRGRALRSVRAVHPRVDLCGQAGRSLCFAQFADDLGPGSLGTLLLWDGIVAAVQGSCLTVAARIDAIALHLSAMAGVTGPLDGRRHDVCLGWRGQCEVDDNVQEKERLSENRFDGASTMAATTTIAARICDRRSYGLAGRIYNNRVFVE
jgi:hypothetical protein